MNYNQQTFLNYFGSQENGSTFINRENGAKSFQTDDIWNYAIQIVKRSDIWVGK